MSVSDTRDSSIMFYWYRLRFTCFIHVSLNVEIGISILGEYHPKRLLPLQNQLGIWVSLYFLGDQCILTFIYTSWFWISCRFKRFWGF